MEVIQQRKTTWAFLRKRRPGQTTFPRAGSKSKRSSCPPVKMLGDSLNSSLVRVTGKKLGVYKEEKIKVN